MKISIITSTYNAAGTLFECLESVAKQGVDVEHILIDGESTDGSMEIVEQYRNSLDKVVSEPDKGIFDAMNKGVAIATGDVVGILNADDYYASNHVLEKVIKVFSDTDVDACYGDLIYIDSKNKNRIVRHWRSGTYNPRKFLWGWMPPHPTFFVRRSVYERLGLFNLDMGSAADYEIMLRFLLKHKVNTVYIPEILVHMRTGGVSNATIKNRFKANRKDRQAWAVNGLKPYPWTLWLKPMRKLGQWVIKREEIQ